MTSPALKLKLLPTQELAPSHLDAIFDDERQRITGENERKGGEDEVINELGRLKRKNRNREVMRLLRELNKTLTRVLESSTRVKYLVDRLGFEVFYTILVDGGGLTLATVPVRAHRVEVVRLCVVRPQTGNPFIALYEESTSSGVFELLRFPPEMFYKIPKTAYPAILVLTERDALVRAIARSSYPRRYRR